MKKQKSSHKWNPEQKLKALIETAALSEDGDSPPIIKIMGCYRYFHFGEY